MVSVNYRNIAILAIIVLVLSVIAYFLVPPASAVIQIGQMDVCYLGETVDLSLALTYPDYTIAWCRSGSECLPPDQIIKITGFVHSYYLDPDVFHVGTYYRWDGAWHRAENQVAFYVKAGKRPVVNTTETTTPTPTPTPEHGIDIKGDGPFQFMITRGDNASIPIHYTSEYDPQGSMWMFGSLKMQLNLPLRKEEGYYWYEMTGTDTAALDAGTYKGYIQFTGKNGIQDVFLSENKTYLESPYDNKIVPDSYPDFWNPPAVKEAFETIVHGAKYSDDVLIPVTMEIVEPSITVEDVVQDDANLYVSGHTSWSEGTVITIRLDPDNYALSQDVRLHTWTAVAEGDILGYRKFSADIPYDQEELYIGIHELKLTVDKNSYINDVYHNFRVTGVWVAPTPTPYIKKILTDINGTQITMRPTIIPTEIPTFNVSTNTSVVNLTPVATRETPNVTITVKPTPTPTRDPNIHVGLPWWVAGAAVVIVWRRKR